MAEVRIYNPDGSEAELSGNGVREAVMYLRRSAGPDRTRSRCAPRPVRSARASRASCARSTWAAALRAPDDFPGGDDGTGTLSRPAASSPSRSCRWATRSARSRCPRAWRSWTWRRYGPPIERHELFPDRTNVSFWRRSGDAAIRARIFERGVGETMSSGTGASGAAVAAVLRGVDSPVTVALDGGELGVEVGEDLHVDLTGWARPVYAGVLSDELIEELHEAE